MDIDTMDIKEENRGPDAMERLFIACFQPSRYKEILSAGVLKHFLYLCGVVFLLLLIEVILPFVTWDISVGGLQTFFKERIPAFSIENGAFQIESPVEFEFSEVIHFKADSGVKEFVKKDLEEKYPEEILISQSNMLVKMQDRIMDIPLSDLTRSRIDNESMDQLVPFLRFLLGVYFFSTYIIRWIEYMIISAFYALLCRAAIRTPEGKSINLRGTFVIALYAKTLFSVIYAVNHCLGSPLADLLIIALGTFGTISYIYRAEAAVLDIPMRRKK